MKEVLLDKDNDELGETIAAMGLPRFRAAQIKGELMADKEFSAMTALPLDLRAVLAERYIARPARISETLTAADGTEKYLFALADGNAVEGVLMKYKYGNTQCVSTQVGCRMNCAFCASGLDGLVRNLSAGEMLGEVIAVNAVAGGTLAKRAVTNVVLMGSGEPLDNYENVVKFIRSLADEDGLNVSPRNISLSTCGLVPQMLRLAKEKLPVNLTVSLHSPFDEERRRIMPIAQRYKIKEILAACDNYFAATGRRFIFEYVLIRNENDGDRHAAELVKLLKGRPCHVNLIRLNEVKERPLAAVDDKNAFRFCNRLIAGGLSATVRRRTGADVLGACGQLRKSRIEERKPKAENNL